MDFFFLAQKGNRVPGVLVSCRPCNPFGPQRKKKDISQKCPSVRTRLQQVYIASFSYMVLSSQVLAPCPEQAHLSDKVTLICFPPLHILLSGLFEREMLQTNSYIKDLLGDLHP